MKIVLDTNVLLAGVATHGLCELLLDACLDEGQHAVYASTYIFDDVSRRLSDKFKMPPDDARLVIEMLREQTQCAKPADVPAGACRDPDDLPILGTLLGADADCLVTGDKDLLSLGSYQGKPILSPRQFYERFCNP